MNAQPHPADDLVIAVPNPEIAARISELATEAASGCGCSHDWYVRQFSSMVDGYIESLPPEDRDEALRIAKRHDYYAGPEPEFVNGFDKDGYCVHGLTWQTCPCGCGG